MIPLRPLAPLLPLALTGCAPAILEERVAALEQRLVLVEAQLRATWELALCSPEARQLLRGVKNLKDCSYKPATGASDACTNVDLSGVVFDTDHKHEGRLLALLGDQRHVPFFFGRSTNALNPARLRSLGAMLTDQQLPTTNYLVVSHPDIQDGARQDDAARERAVAVIHQLLQRRVTPAHILIWLYAFPITRAALAAHPADLPRSGESDRLERSVWVFRVDC